MGTEMGNKSRYIKYLGTVKWQYMSLLFAYLCVIVTQLQIPQMVSRMLTTVTGDGKDIAVLTAMLCGLIALEAVGTHCFGHLNYKLSNQLLVEAEQDILQHLTRISYQKISGMNSAYLGQQLNNDLCFIMDFYVEKIPLLAFQAIKGTTILILLFTVNLYVGIFAALGGGIYIALYFMTRKRYYRLNEQHTRAKSMLSSVICGKLSRILIIKLNSWYQATQKDFRAFAEKFVKIAVKYLDYDNFTSNLSNVIGRLLIPAMLLGLYFGREQRAGISHAGVFAMALLYMQELIAVIKYVVQGGKFYQAYKVSHGRVEQLLELPKEKCGAAVLEKINKVEIRQLTFSYGDFPSGRFSSGNSSSGQSDIEKKVVLQNFSYTFEKGKLYGICGENGSGKSTLFLLMTGILEPESGEILWEGQSVSEINMEDLRRSKVGFVNQEPLLMEGSIHDNLFYGRDEEKMVMGEWEKSPLLDFVASQQSGYDTQVNSQSSNLSGGQKQRIAIMRALLKKADVLLLDEPTSALDREGIQIFTEVLQQLKRDKIILIITHDPYIRDICDQIVNLP